MPGRHQAGRPVECAGADRDVAATGTLPEQAGAAVAAKAAPSLVGGLVPRDLVSAAQIHVRPSAGGIADIVSVPMQALAAMAPHHVAHLAAYIESNSAAQAPGTVLQQFFRGGRAWIKV